MYIYWKIHFVKKTLLFCISGLKFEQRILFEKKRKKNESWSRQSVISKSEFEFDRWHICVITQNIKYTLYYLLREQDRLTIFKFFYHPELFFHVLNEIFLPPWSFFHVQSNLVIRNVLIRNKLALRNLLWITNPFIP